MGVETKLHEPTSRLGLVGDAVHKLVEGSIAVTHIARFIGRDALDLVRGRELSELQTNTQQPYIYE